MDLEAARSRLAFALDLDDPDGADVWIDRLAGEVGLLKIGSVTFARLGPEVVRRARARGHEIFLDLKLHDIPATVEGAAREAARLGVRMMTVHALGGPKMIEAARRGLARGAALVGVREPALLAVTVLTSHVEADLRGVGVEGPIARRVVALAQMAVAAGASGVVSSPEELLALAEALPAGALRVTPGIRGPGEATQDQARTLPADEAIRRGATHLVVGRPIRDAVDPVAAARALVERIARALPGPPA